MKEDASLLSLRERFAYRLIRFLGYLQQLVYLKMLKTYVWRSADGRLTPIHKLGDRHLSNILRMLRGDPNTPPLVYLLLKAEEARRNPPNVYPPPREPVYPPDTSKQTMSKQEFKARWDSNDTGGGITFEDIAKCAKGWGLFEKPKTQPMEKVTNAVLKAAGCSFPEE